MKVVRREEGGKSRGVRAVRREEGDESKGVIE